MKDCFRSYRKRNILFDEKVNLENWVVKVYTITTEAFFESGEVLVNVKGRLPTLLKEAKDHHNSAFLIVHEGTDGVWSLVNWWTGNEMLRTNTYFTSYKEKEKISLFPTSGSMACVWELPVINHEKNAWIQHVLMKASNPDFQNYYKDTIQGSI